MSHCPECGYDVRYVNRLRTWRNRATWVATALLPSLLIASGAFGRIAILLPEFGTLFGNTMYGGLLLAPITGALVAQKIGRLIGIPNARFRMISQIALAIVTTAITIMNGVALYAFVLYLRSAIT